MCCRLFLIGCLLAAALTASAHETWLMPTTFAARIDETVSLDLTSGMAFPRLEFPIKAPRVALARYRLNQTQADLSKREAAATSLVLRQSFPKEGLVTAWLDLAPKDIALSDDKVAEYLGEIDATPEIRSLWAAQKGRIPWKETYTKHAKTFVAVGNAPDDVSWKTAVGAKLEFVPLTDPLTAQVGGETSVELRLDSKPLAAIPVGLLVEGAAGRVFRTTDETGRATFPLPRAGRAMFFAVRLQFDQDRQEWSSDFCTLTFEVHPAH